MKKTLIGATTFTILLAVSCKKKDDGSSAKNIWKFRGNAFTATSVTKSTVAGVTSVIAADNNNNNVRFVFSVSPAADAAYEVCGDVLNADAQRVTIGATINGVNYFSSGNDHVSAAVKVKSGKVTITVPDVWMANKFKTDSTKLSANNITEQ